MLKSLTHQSQKLGVTVKVVEIQSKTKVDSTKTMMCQIGRSNDSKTSSFITNKPLNLSFHFVGTFYFGKSKAKEKDVTIMLYLDNDKKVNGQLTLNVSEFVSDKDITHECTRRVLFNGGMYTIQINVLISYQFSEETPKSPTASITITTPTKSPLVVHQTAGPKKDLRQTRSMTSLNTLSNTDVPLSPRRMRGEPRLDSPSRRVIPSKLPPDPKKNGYPQTPLRSKMAYSTTTYSDASECESESHLSGALDEIDFSVNGKQFFQDISGYASILEVEEEVIQKGEIRIDYPVLAQIIWKTIDANSLISIDAPFFGAVVYEIEKMMNGDVIQLRQLAYLQSTLVWICVFIAESLKEVRDVRMMTSFNLVVKESNKCQIILMNFIKKALSDTIKSWLDKQEETSIITDYIEKVVSICKRMNFPQTYFTIMMNDIVRLINDVITDVVAHSNKTIIDTGIYLQISGSLLVDIFDRNKIECDIPLIKELSAVLIIQNKDILATNECCEICPHLPTDMLVSLLTNLKEHYPECVSVGTITLIGKEKDQSHYYDTTLNLLKHEKMKEIVKDSCNDQHNTPDLTNVIPLFNKRDYLHTNGIF
ncbi:C2 NT-type domain-containing protein [Entamoeba marina]